MADYGLYTKSDRQVLRKGYFSIYRKWIRRKSIIVRLCNSQGFGYYLSLLLMECRQIQIRRKKLINLDR